METTHRYMAIIWMADGSNLSVGLFDTIEDAQLGEDQKTELVALHDRRNYRKIFCAS